MQTHLFQHFWRHRVAVTLLIAALFTAAWAGVYISGGTKFAHLHLIYVPIIIAAFRFNLWGGMVGGIIGTVLMGPLMPLDVALDQAQSLHNWIARGGYLTAFGAVIGALHATILKGREELFRIANYDPITHLPLFEAFRREVTAAMEENKDGACHHAVLNMELSNSGDILSSFGSQLHEELIKSCADRLSGLLPEGSFIARGGSSRFLVLLKNVDNEPLTRIPEALVRAFDDEVVAEGVPVRVLVAVGVACFPEHGDDTDELVRASHSAVSEQVSGTARVSFFNAGHDAALRQNLEMLSELNAALTGGGIYFAAQPKIWLKDFSLGGIELLARWRHAQRGFIPPSQFIPVAEQSGIIDAITEASLVAAREYLRRSDAVLPGIDFRIAVNVTGRDLADSDFPDRLLKIFEGDGAALERLELEITETAVIEDFGEIMPVLERLRRMGVHIAIDDYGTGFSSLSYLKDIQADSLKIDQSFVRGILESRKDEILVRRTIELARDLGMRTVAEGVETEEIANWLWAAGCDVAQGYFYAKPINPEDWDAWLRDYCAANAAEPTSTNIA